MGYFFKHIERDLKYDVSKHLSTFCADDQKLKHLLTTGIIQLYRKDDCEIKLNLMREKVASILSRA
jgi:hypothetical protein